MNLLLDGIQHRRDAEIYYQKVLVVCKLGYVKGIRLRSEPENVSVRFAKEARSTSRAKFSSRSRIFRISEMKVIVEHVK